MSDYNKIMANYFYDGSEVMGSVDSQLMSSSSMFNSAMSTSDQITPQSKEERPVCRIDLSHLRCMIKSFDQDNECKVFQKNLKDCKHARKSTH